LFLDDGLHVVNSSGGQVEPLADTFFVFVGLRGFRLVLRRFLASVPFTSAAAPGRLRHEV
jgi:hypothetical protein